MTISGLIVRGFNALTNSFPLVSRVPSSSEVFRGALQVFVFTVNQSTNLVRLTLDARIANSYTTFANYVSIFAIGLIHEVFPDRADITSSRSPVDLASVDDATFFAQSHLADEGFADSLRGAEASFALAADSLSRIQRLFSIDPDSVNTIRPQLLVGFDPEDSANIGAISPFEQTDADLIEQSRFADERFAESLRRAEASLALAADSLSRMYAINRRSAESSD